MTDSQPDPKDNFPFTNYPVSGIDAQGRSTLKPGSIVLTEPGQYPIPVPAVPGAAVGRIVHYYRMDAKVSVAEQSPLASIITEVHDTNGHVALEVFGLSERVVHRSVPFGPVPRPGSWSWPPRV